MERWTCGAGTYEKMLHAKLTGVEDLRPEAFAK